ncbi:hypothetical protein MuYL_0510 [Mucilaginibacter xinganensis]|uniref:Uncharacterized protein n=1 Tax=Mucilaginibacter xinganensis TaxID=1234841 RepID=A0A223NRC6_9SPHI|nr:hypothetical protein MuYL_0510 [Mucilaginibacter xinganensis]
MNNFRELVLFLHTVLFFGAALSGILKILQIFFAKSSFNQHNAVSIFHRYN